MRFLLVGGTCFLVTCSITYVLKLSVLATKPVTALVIATVVATVLSYVLNRGWTFRTRGGRRRYLEATLFAVTNGIAIEINAAPLWVARYVLGLHTPEVSRLVQEVSDFVFGILAGTALAMAFRLWAYRNWVFPEPLARRPAMEQRREEPAMFPEPGPASPLTRAALFAGRAPSLHNTQPWHWHAETTRLELRLEPSRVLRAVDPDARLAILSCGVALHHARIHLAAAGRRIDVIRLPDLADPDLLARIMLGEPAPADPDAVRLVEAVRRRTSDRRTFTAAPVDLHRVHTVRSAIRREGAELAVLRPDQVIILARAAEHAYQADSADPARAESAAWIGGDRSLGTGIPANALPADPYLTGLTQPARLMRRAGTTLIAESHHHAAVFALLSTTGDGPADWLSAGQALSAGWLTATLLGIAVLPMSAVVEITASRDLLRPLLHAPGHPQLALRLATASDTPTPATPRIAPEAIVS